MKVLCNTIFSNTVKSTMNLSRSLDFLQALSGHNSKEWMDANRSWYLDAKQEFIGFIDQIIQQMRAFEPAVEGLQGKDTIFRINRDIRFSNDKRPYKENFGSAISEGGRHSGNPTYYLHLQPGEVFVGGGIYMPQAEVLKKIRQEVDYNPGELKRIVEAPEFKDLYGQISGEKLKTAPKGYPKDHPNIEFLKLKSYVVMHRISDAVVRKEGFSDVVVRSFQTMKPFNDYLAVAVS